MTGGLGEILSCFTGVAFFVVIPMLLKMNSPTDFCSPFFGQLLLFFATRIDGNQGLPATLMVEKDAAGIDWNQLYLPARERL